MKMTYQDYVALSNMGGNLSREQMNLLMQVEGACDIILYYIKENEETLEEAIVAAEEKTGAPEDIMELAIASAKEQLALFKECEEKGHDFKSEDYGTSETGYTGASCNRCGYTFGKTLY